MWTNRPLHLASLLAVGVIAAGCDVGTELEVDETFDAEAALEDYQAMEAALASDEWSAIRGLNGRTPFDAGLQLASPTVDGLTLRDGGRAFALELADRLVERRAAAAAGPAQGPIISGWHRGTTFVYDPEVDEYRPDLERTDAPPTGVRFVLYELDQAGRPILDEVVGHADLIDEGDGSTEDIVLHLIVVHTGTTVLDYRTTLDHDATSGSLTVDGFLRGDGVQLDFDLGIEAERVGEVGHLDIGFAFGVDARDFEVFGSVSGVEEAEEGAGDVEVTVRHGDDSIEVDMSGAQGELDGTIHVNGSLFATVSGPANDPVILGATGAPLRWNEVLVLRRVVDVVEDVFDFLEDLVEPVGALVVLGIIL